MANEGFKQTLSNVKTRLPKALQMDLKNQILFKSLKMSSRSTGYHRFNLLYE